MPTLWQGVLVMQIKCPKCGSLVGYNGKTTKCPFCRSTIDLPNPSEKQSSLLTKVNASSDVYDQNSGRVCLIENIQGKCRGTGFLISKDGLILTNAHVVFGENDRPSNTVKLILDGVKYEADVLKSNQPVGDEDIALCKINQRVYLSPVKLGDSDKIKNGEDDLAIGNPKGEGLSITRGIVSDKNRVFEGSRYIMCDVSINPGNSGGPLFNDNGDVIAVCVSKRVDADDMNYFIPINKVKDILHRWGY